MKSKEKIALIGTGMMGASLSALFTGNGFPIKVLATKESSAERCRKNYNEIFETLKARGLVNDSQAAASRKLLSFTLDYADLADAELVIESAVEDTAVKFDIYRKIESNCPNVRAIASTTSALSPDDLIKGLTKYADRLVVAHPFNPPHLVPFIEMVRSEKTSDEAAQLVYDVLERCGRKVCVMKKSAPGFIANRLQHALLREAMYMVDRGLAEPRDIDKALMYSFMPRYTSVGLFEHQDAAGLDMVKSIQDYLFADLCDYKCAFPAVNDAVACCRCGQKDGAGTYEWTEESKADFKRRAAEPYWKYFNWDLPQQ